MTIEIRLATIRDSKALANLSGELGYPSTADEIEARLAAMDNQAGHQVWVAENEAGEIVAWIHAFIALRLESPAFAELGGLVVARAQQARGIGRRLVEVAAQWAGEMGSCKLRVRSRQSRGDAHAFYKCLGFSQTKSQGVLDLDLPW